MDILQLKNVNKIYGGKIPYRALTDIQLAVQKGEFVGIMGPSGSGKTTLLNLIATIDSPSSGEIIINGKQLSELKGKKMAHFRRRQLGFVFQDFNLLDTLTIAENIVLPLTLDGAPLVVMKDKLKHVAENLGITEILNKRTYEVSGGQAQRAAIARAIIHTPALLLADEPTGNLDSKASKNVMEALEMINQTEDATLLMVTHDALAASYCHRVVFIKDGQLYNELHRGDSRQRFFQQIIDVLSLLGGNAHDLSTVRV